MFNRIKIDNMKPLLTRIVKAVEKGCGEDIREYLMSTDKATNNAVRLMRADNINTNLRDSVASETVELKYFNRSAWVGCLLIDRENSVTYTICTKQTLESIPKKPNRRIPHYLQTILHIQNAEVEAPYKQMDLSEFMPGVITEFSDEEYEEDYQKIMDDDLTFDDNYLHLVIVYEAAHYNITSIAMRILDKDCQTAKEYPLTSLLQPDFGELTRQEEKEQKKDAHKLVSVKPGLKKKNDAAPQQETKISAKKLEEKKAGLTAFGENG